MNIDLHGLPNALRDILRAYATLCPIRCLAFPLDLPFRQVHDFLLNYLLLHPFFLSYPPSPQYQQQFWKWALAQLESMPMNEDDDEIDGRLYEHHVSLVSRPTTSLETGSLPPAPSYFTYFWKRDYGSEFDSATLLESRTTIESGTTGLKTWRASLVLAQYLIEHPDIVQDKRLLELGSGVGLLGIVAAAIQWQQPVIQGSICLTDVNQEVLARCAENLRLPCNKSSVHPNVKTAYLDWTDSTDPTGITSVQDLLADSSPDVILGADVVYDPRIIPPLIETLKIVLQDRSRIALIALTERNENTLAQFVWEAKAALSTEELLVEQTDLKEFWGIADLGDSMPDQTVKIFQLRARAR